MRRRLLRGFAIALMLGFGGLLYASQSKSTTPARPACPSLSVERACPSDCLPCPECPVCPEC